MSTGSNIISAVGAGSGLDVAGIVDGLVEADKAAPQARIDSQKTTYEAQLSAYGVLRSSISAFQDVLAPLSNPDTFNARSLAFPESNFIRPESIEPGAQLGTYQLEVDQVAQSQTLVSKEIDSEQNLGAGKVTFNFVKPATHTVTSGVHPAVQGPPTADDSLLLELNGVDIPLKSTGNFADNVDLALDAINDAAPDSGVYARRVPAPNSIELYTEDGSPFEMRVDTSEGIAGGNGDARLDEFGMVHITHAEKFAINDEHEPLEIELLDGDTLDDLVEKINKADRGIQASVIETDGKKQLMLIGPSGEAQQMEIEVEGADGNPASADLQKLAFDHDDANSPMLLTQEGRDAEIRVNGLRVVRDSNNVDDVIPGLTFTLDKAMTDPGDKVTFTVTESKETAEQAILNFVEGYNALQATFNNLTGVTTASPEEGIEEDQVGILNRDSTTKQLYQNVKGILSSAAGAGDQEIFLAELGIRTKLDGTLEFDDTQGSDGKTDLERMLDENFDRLEALFALSMDTSSPHIEINTARDIGNILSGTYDIEITKEPTQAQTTLKAFDDWILDDPADGSPNVPGSGDSTAFKLEIGDGTDGESTISTNTLNLKEIIDAANPTTHQEFADALEKAINNDENFKRDDLTVNVEAVLVGTEYELVFTSDKYGDNRQIGFTDVVDPNNKFGLGNAADVVKVDGGDVEGSINGEEAFGSGNVLLPAIGGTMTGVNFIVEPGSLGTSTFTFERGVAGDLNAMLANATRTTSTDTNPSELGLRETNINEGLSRLEREQEELDARLEKVRARYQAQYSAMDAIMSQFQRDSSTLDNLLATLPFNQNNNR